MQYSGFLFDMDGTMVNNMMVHHRAWQIKLKELDLDLTLEEVRQTIHGKNEEILERLFGDRFTPAERAHHAWDKEARYREVFRDSLALVPGCMEFLEAAHAKGIPMAIGTAAPAENVNFVLDTLNIGHFFKGVIHAGLVKKGKPDPQVFKIAAATMGLLAEQCLVFEDSPTGVQTALNCGADAVVITTTHTPSEFAHFENVIRFVPDFGGMGEWLLG
jgi:beta-phosphoglucomutase